MFGTQFLTYLTIQALFWPRIDGMDSPESSTAYYVNISRANINDMMNITK